MTFRCIASHFTLNIGRVCPRVDIFAEPPVAITRGTHSKMAGPCCLLRLGFLSSSQKVHDHKSSSPIHELDNSCNSPRRLGGTQHIVNQSRSCWLFVRDLLPPVYSLLLFFFFGFFFRCSFDWLFGIGSTSWPMTLHLSQSHSLTVLSRDEDASNGGRSVGKYFTLPTSSLALASFDGFKMNRGIPRGGESELRGELGALSPNVQLNHCFLQSDQKVAS